MRKSDVLKLSLVDSLSRLDALYAEYLEFRFRKALGNLRSHPLRGKNLRRDIARMKTIISEYDKGVRK